MDYVDEYIFDDVYVLLGEDGSVVRDDGRPYTQFISDKAWVNNHAHVLQGRESISTEHLYLFLSSKNISPYVTGAVQLKLNQKNMNNIPFVKAPDELNEAFGALVKPLFKTREKNQKQSSTLIELRDSLLPKLLSGELALSETEAESAVVADV